MASTHLSTPPYPGVLQRLGSRGGDVQVIQERLNALGQQPPLAPDGIFGPRTEAAVMAFQRRVGLNPDGIVGPLTWGEIMRQITLIQIPPYPGVLQRVGSRGDSVRIIQERLNALGQQPPLVPDGIFGPRTEAAVIAFQRHYGLSPDGIVGPFTWAELMRQSATVPPVVPPPVTPPPVVPPPSTQFTIVLDPGHGGSDVGAAFAGRLEKDDCLRLALAVRNLLAAQGQRVVMTRSTDVAVPLTTRSTISNQNNANIFVSIHRNASTNTAANGVENYVFTTAPVVDAVYAHTVLDEVVAAGVQSNRGVMRANFAVLRNTNAPAMLLEMGFITNARDNQLFDQNFNAYAAAIARGIMTSLNRTGPLPPASAFYTVIGGDNLYALANRFGTTANAIMTLNRLTSPHLIIGQVLRIPGR